MKWPWKWESGRRSPEYQKMRIIIWLFFDIYILKFPPGCVLLPHKDKVPGKKHHRINITIREAESGGIFYIGRETALIQMPRRIIRFRPDVWVHSQTKVEGSKTKYMLSIGWVTK